MTSNYKEIEHLIESIKLPTKVLKQFLLDEIDEFLESESPEDMEEELGDVLFSLRSLSYYHTNRHFQIGPTYYYEKIFNRLLEYGSISKNEMIFDHDLIQDMEFSVVHFAFSNFNKNWSKFSPLKNGTTAEITALTDNYVSSDGKLANHLIVTFDDVNEVNFKLIYSSQSIESDNTVLCTIPNFLYQYSKEKLVFDETENLMALQVMAALNKLKVRDSGILHFHSWEAGVLLNSNSFSNWTEPYYTIFSPYLTVTRLYKFMTSNGQQPYTLNSKLAPVAIDYELKMMHFCSKVVFESNMDAQFYQQFIQDSKTQIVSFSENSAKNIQLEDQPIDELKLITGGRAVFEKGFLQLCDSMKLLVDWANDEQLPISLTILCRDPKKAKEKNYIEMLEAKIKDLGLEQYVFIQDKISVGLLKEKIKESTALIVPSLFDPYCLMPCYAMEEGRISFVSKHAGISENIESREHLYDPLEKESLLRVVQNFYYLRPEFRFTRNYPSFKGLYLNEQKVQHEHR